MSTEKPKEKDLFSHPRWNDVPPCTYLGTKELTPEDEELSLLFDEVLKKYGIFLDDEEVK